MGRTSVVKKTQAKQLKAKTAPVKKTNAKKTIKVTGSSKGSSGLQITKTIKVYKN